MDKNNTFPGGAPANEAHSAGRSFGVMRSLAFVAMVLTVALSVAVSVYLGNTARDTLIRKNQDFASLLASNLNNQIYRRFSLPTILFHGPIALRDPEQFKQLDQIVQSIIQDLQVDDLRIFSNDHTVTYSTNKDEPGSSEAASPSVDLAVKAEGPIFDIDAAMSYSMAFFTLSLPRDTYRMRTTYRMRAPERLRPSELSELLRVAERLNPSLPAGAADRLSRLDDFSANMGVLEFSQDFTQDMEHSVRFQQLVLAVTLLGSGMLMALLLLLVRRAERAIALRTAEEQRLLNELHQHEKLAGMGRVVAGIAHEIRNPLGIISSSAEFLLNRQGDEKSGSARILQAIYDEARRLTRTVSDFLDYARPRQPVRDSVDVVGVISQALAFLAPDIGAREIAVLRSGDQEGALVPGDKDLLYRAFYNIMSNALQAMGSGGILSIEVRRSADAGKKVPDVILSFRDSGPGFPQEYMDKILDPFFTTKDGGTGLGLPIVNNIISSHGGSLELFNSPEGGAAARVVLPGVPAPAPQA
ncbi:MAG: two-component sensor histidine kinase [Desulfovibrio sp.]|jgi:signal transduction histidine kinase|nr:two-component sensor histidine kinase [Desulfovibrio sp.]